jgi:phospholipid/cholesterol/gamma-HCH transport system permease protein
MTQAGIEIEKSENGAFILRLDGRLDRDRIAFIWQEALRQIKTAGIEKLVLDFKEVAGIDSAGIALLRCIEGLCADRGIRLAKRGIPAAVDQFLNYVEEHAAEHREERPPSPPGALSRLGDWSLERMREARAFVRFIGDFVVAVAVNVFDLRRLRLREIVYQLQVTGSESMPLVAGLSFLMGIIMAFQAAITLKTFGAAIYVADIVTISATREMGPLLTAVIIAGRSGAAFAAEIGTMKINEEIDALTVMGFDITRFLVLPRVLALALAGPFLTLLADAAGILGGAWVGVMVLDLSLINYFSEVNKILTPEDIYTGLIKGFSFAFLVGLVGCFRGLRTGLAAESVGIQATSAVVTGILLIIIADAVLTAIFQIYGW